MKGKLLLLAMLLAAFQSYGQRIEPVRINIEAGKKIATVTKQFNGTNIEDLNNQTNGGIFSQLLHGEAFEENVDPDFLHLERKDYSKVYLVLDERRVPHLFNIAVTGSFRWNKLSDRYDFNSADIYAAGKYNKPANFSGWKFPGPFLVYDSLPPNIQRLMMEKVNGNEQISKYWSKQISGSPKYAYQLIRDGKAYMGRQTQRLTFADGTGEVGLTNQGLYRSGIMFEKGKSYDGILRVKTDQPKTIYLSLRDDHKVLAERAYQLKGDGSYEKLMFELTPDRTTIHGSFGIALKTVGTVDLGFAFLEPGPWGRIAGGWPIRKAFTDALKRQGITAIRYNGSMVDHSIDTNLYRWKLMRGPIDERRIAFRSGFNPYATHSFGIIEMLQAAEAINATAIIGMNMNETSGDIRDFVEYVNGPVQSKWGGLRAADGHAKAYRLKYIEVHNEQRISNAYLECVKKFASAAWTADPDMSIMVSLNIGRDGYKKDGTEQQRQEIARLRSELATIKQNQQDGNKKLDSLGKRLQQQQAHLGEQYRLAADLVKWFIAQGKGDKLAWDPHYTGTREFADSGDGFLNEMGINLQSELAKDFPGFKLNLHPMEENGSRCDWDRGLAHAHNWNTLQRYGDCFRMLGTANTFQPFGFQYKWDQGRIHYTPDAIWFQPSACIDEMMMQTWKPNVIASSSSDAHLDVTAKINNERTAVTLYVANLSDKPIGAVLNIKDFNFHGLADIETIGDCELTEYNTYENRDKVVFRPSKVSFTPGDSKYTFPKYSYTVITLNK